MEKSRLDQIQDFLVTHGASIFSSLLYEVPRFNNIENKYTMIFAPDDAAIRRLENATGKSIGELYRDPAGLDILANHISTSPTQKTYPMFTAINGTKYGSSANDIAALGIVAKTVIDRVPILVISQIIIQGNQVQTAKAQRDPGVFGRLNYQNFINLVNLGQLEGEDLISFCLTNKEVNDMCDKVDSNGETIFHKLIRSKFKEEVPPGESAREYYITRYSGYDLIEVSDKGVKDYKINGVVDVYYGEGGIVIYNVDGNVFRIINKGTKSEKALKLNPEGVKIKKIVVKNAMYLAIDTNGNALSMGPNNFGTLGYPGIDQVDKLYKIPGVSNIVDITIARNNIFLLRNDGMLLYTTLKGHDQLTLNLDLLFKPLKSNIVTGGLSGSIKFAEGVNTLHYNYELQTSKIFKVNSIGSGDDGKSLMITGNHSELGNILYLLTIDAVDQRGIYSFENRIPDGILAKDIIYAYRNIIYIHNGIPYSVTPGLGFKPYPMLPSGSPYIRKILSLYTSIYDKSPFYDDSYMYRMLFIGERGEFYSCIKIKKPGDASGAVEIALVKGSPKIKELDNYRIYGGTVVSRNFMWLLVKPR